MDGFVFIPLTVALQFGWYEVFNINKLFCNTLTSAATKLLPTVSEIISPRDRPVEIRVSEIIRGA
jgi:hypothetical protein